MFPLLLVQGMLLLQRDDGSSSPVAIEMTEGCLNSEAWLLARRLQAAFADACVEDTATVEISP